MTWRKVSCPRSSAQKFDKDASLQAAFYVGYTKDLWCGFPHRSIYWRMVVVFGVKQRKTEVVSGLGLPQALA